MAGKGRAEPASAQKLRYEPYSTALCNDCLKRFITQLYRPSP